MAAMRTRPGPTADTADNCPHIANLDQSNVDADGVGDACDAGAVAEQIVLFDPFVAPTSWQIGGTTPLTYDQESVTADTRAGKEIRAFRDFALGFDRIVVGGHVGQRDISVRRQVFVGVHESLNAFYYCELFENGAIQKYGLAHTPDYMIFTTVDSATATAPLENGDFRLEITTPTTPVVCSTTWPVDRAGLISNTPVIATNQIEVYAQGVEIRIDYVVVIRRN
jgi:hypothetical protein